MTSPLWAQALQAKLGQVEPLELLQQAQTAALAAGHTFTDHPGPLAALHDLQGEVEELAEALTEGASSTHLRNEIGDVVFSLLRVCHQHNISLTAAIEHFTRRWLNRKALQEQHIVAAGYTWANCPPELNNQIWRDVKTALKQQEYQE